MDEDSDIIFVELLEKGKNLMKVNPNTAIANFQKVITMEIPTDFNEVEQEDAVRAKEQAIYALGSAYAEQKMVSQLGTLLVDIRPFFETISKAKTAKIVKTLINDVGLIEGNTDVQIKLCVESVAWCEREKRTYLRQRIQAKLAMLYLETKHYQAALKLISKLLLEVKKLEDKQLLVELHLTESHIQIALQNLPKAKAALTACRAAANTIYVVPLLQAEIDLQAGALASSEKDFKTGFSYFYEAFEGFDNVHDPRAATGLKYMLLCKIMNQQSKDVKAIVTNKLALKYAGPQVDAMLAVAAAAKNRSVKCFREVLEDSKHKDQLLSDPTVARHLNDLSESLMENNLLKLIEPYSRVQISKIATLIELPENTVQSTIAKLILDKKFNGILLPGIINAYPDAEPDKVFDYALETIDTVGSVVGKLFDKASVLR